MNYLSAQQFKELLKDKKVKLLDVREAYEFKAGRIRGAKLTPSTNFWAEFEKLKIKKSDKIALYCRSGGRSEFVGRDLMAKGYKNVYNLELGLLDWAEAGYQLVN